MANVKKELRVSDTDIKRLNHMGLGLKAIAEILGCHPATITLRLKALGIEPTDTRRSFMEGVFTGLDTDVQEWLSHNLYEAGIGVKEFVSSLIREAYEATGKTSTVPAVPAPMPEMDGGITTEPGPIHPNPDELTTGTYEVGGASEKPDPAQKVIPEVLEEQPEEKPASLPPKPPKLKFAE